jgi:uncharacterized OsmC-like protein
MNSDELRSIQAPLKAKYKENPKSAIVTLKAEGVIGDNVSCKIETGRALVEAGLHPATGGSGMLACSGDMLLEALVACAGVTMNAVATAIEFKMKTGVVKAEGDLDFKGTLGVDKESTVGFKNIRLRFELDTEESEEKIQTLIRLTERYCVVYQTLLASPSFEVGYQKAS